MTLHRIWGGDSADALPTDGSHPVTSGYGPPVGGWRFDIITQEPYLEPARGGRREHDEYSDHFDAVEEDGMHATDSVDMFVVLSGTPKVELGDGGEVVLAPGDTFVQNGTLHRCSNPGPERAVVAVFMVGAQRPL